MSSVITPPPSVTSRAQRAQIALPSGSRMLRWVWPGPALFVLFWLALLVGGGRFLRDPGQFWHTSVGEKILTGGFFDADPYTFTHGGEKWIPHQWLGEVTMALAHRVGGFDALLVGATAMMAALYAWLAAKLIRTGLHPVFAVGVVLLAVAAAGTHFHVRPHLFTMIGMAATMHAAVLFENRRAGWKGLLWLIPLYLVWTNTHGGMLGGLTTLVLAGAGWVLFGRGGVALPFGSRLTGVIPFALVVLACGLTAFVTPYGSDIVQTWLYINNGMSRLPEIIAEHAPLDVTDPKAWPLIALAAVYLTLLAATLPRRPKVVWLLPLFWLAQAYLRVRHGALFAPLAVLAVIDLWPHTRFARWLEMHRADVYAPPTAPPRPAFAPILLTAAVGVLLAVGCQWLNVSVPLIGKGTAKLDPTLWPTELHDDLTRLEPRSGEPNRIFCEYLYGGYLEYHTPGYKVFVDDRCELFGDDWLVEFVKADEADTTVAMERWQQRWGKWDYALTTTTDRDLGFDWYFRTSNEWVLVKRTDTASLYRRSKLSDQFGSSGVGGTSVIRTSISMKTTSALWHSLRLCFGVDGSRRFLASSAVGTASITSKDVTTLLG